MKLTEHDPATTRSDPPRRRAFEFRAREDGDTTTIAGYASVFGSRNSYGEVFVPGAYLETLATKSASKPLVMGYLHREPVGRWQDFAEHPDTGLFLEGPISQTERGKDASILVRDGVLTGLSIGFWPLVEACAEPGEEVVFQTPYGEWRHREDRWTWYVLKADLVEASLVMAPSDDEARLTEVRSIELLERASRALPAIAGEESSWEDAAYSMGLLMGGRGAAAFSDLAEPERQALYERVCRAYERHDKTPPPFTAQPAWADIPFQHDEREVFCDRYLGKTLAAVTAGAAGVSGPLSATTRQRATEARDALAELLAPPAAPLDAGTELARLRAALDATTRSLKEGDH